MATAALHPKPDQAQTLQHRRSLPRPAVRLAVIDSRSSPYIHFSHFLGTENVSTEMTTKPVTRRLAAILVADVVGYSRLVRADEEATIHALNSLRADIVDQQIAEHSGRIFKLVGDGILAEFPSVVEAVRAAGHIQQAVPVWNANRNATQPIELRIGVNLGDVIVDGDDLHGDGVNVASRLEALAQPGGLCISDAVYEQIRDRIDLVFEYLGEREIKNIDRPVRVWRWATKGSPVESTSKRQSHAEGKPSIAVLPFANMSGDPEQEYFADGMVEDIITGLARMRWLTVIARNSTFAYKGTSPDIRKVGQELCSRYVVEGSVRKAGNQVRLTAQLIEAESGGHRWADRFDGTQDDIFDLQDKVTTGIVAAIEPSIREAEIERAKRKRPDSLDAYDLYLRALDQSYSYTPAGRDAGLSLLEAAIAVEPDYAQAHGVAAFCLQQRFLWGGRAPEDRKAALTHARAVAASRTDDGSTLAFAALALSALASDHDTARVMLDRALELNPSSATAHNAYALLTMMTNQPDKSIFHAECSLRLSPFDPLRHIPECTLAAAKLAGGEAEEALAHVRKGLDATPAFSPGLVTLALCLVRLGRMDDARSTIRRLVEIAPDTQIANLQERYLFSNTLGIDDITTDLRSAGLPE